MEMKPGASAINIPGERPKKSKLESALTYMNLASTGLGIAKGIGEMSSGSGGSPSSMLQYKSKIGKLKSPFAGMTKRILGGE